MTNADMTNTGHSSIQDAGNGSASNKTKAPAPLKGLRVANFGWVLAGPIVGQTLAFLGAEVYKIESAARIDMARTIPSFAEGIKDPNRSLSQHTGWAGNGSVTLNLKDPRGVELALELIAECDVVVENFGPGVMEKLGLGYEVVKKAREDIIMFSMPSAGLDGPLSNIRTYGLSLASITGLDSITGYDGGPPIAMENAFSDPYNGIMGAFSIIVAVHHRNRTGQGQHIDCSQQEVLMQLMGPAFMDYVMNGRVAAPRGNRHPTDSAAPHGVFPCAGEDRWISIAIIDDDEWAGFIEATGNLEWTTDERFTTLASRLDNIGELHEAIAEWTATQNDRELAELLQNHGVAAVPVSSVADLWNDPHFKARGTFFEVTHPLGFPTWIYGDYVKMSQSEVPVKPGPVLGSDNEHVFLDIVGLSRERYDELVEAQVIY